MSVNPVSSHIFDELSDVEMDTVAPTGLSDEDCHLYPTVAAQEYLAIYSPIIDHDLFQRRIASGEPSAVALHQAMLRWAAQRRLRVERITS